jgi:site-specific recombinase XerD
MFERLFQIPQVVARHRNGPLAEERCRYLAHRAEQQASMLTLRGIAFYTLVVAKALRLADRPGELITREEIEVAAKRWAHRRAKPPTMRFFDHAYRGFKGHALRWLTFLGRLQQPTSVQRPYASHVAQFTDYQLRERGLAPSTVAYGQRTIHDFLADVKASGLRLQTLTVAEVDNLLVQKVRDEEYSRVTVRTWVSALRPFFRFAEGRGWCRQGLAAAIMAPRVFRQEHLPLGPKWNDVRRLLAAAEGGRPVDIRARALLMLLTVYGLRAGEVTTLRLENFDWEQEILQITHTKSRRSRVYPLCRSVGDAVLRYLREVRPRSNRREVFLALRAPFGPLTPSALGIMVRRRLHTLGLSLPHYGPHVLRHACATHLLAQGLSLNEIGDHLGHRSPEATSIYAKVDLAALRAVADLGLEDLL